MSAVSYRRGSPGDGSALERLLKSLSPDSAYARFQAPLGSYPPPALVDALLPAGLGGGAVLAWDGGTLVGHGLWVRLGPSRVAEIALVVTDSHQGRGIGTALAGLLVEAATARGIDRFEVYSEARNRAVERMVARGAPGAERERDGFTVTYSFAVGERAASRPHPARWRDWSIGLTNPMAGGHSIGQAT